MFKTAFSVVSLIFLLDINKLVGTPLDRNKLVMSVCCLMLFINVYYLTLLLLSEGTQSELIIKTREVSRTCLVISTII